MKLIQMKKKQTKSEFERESIPKNKLKSWKSFLGMYAGEHAAGTEFMIGPNFLQSALVHLICLLVYF